MSSFICPVSVGVLMMAATAATSLVDASGGDSQTNRVSSFWLRTVHIFVVSNSNLWLESQFHCYTLLAWWALSLSPSACVCFSYLVFFVFIFLLAIGRTIAFHSGNDIEWNLQSQSRMYFWLDFFLLLLLFLVFCCFLWIRGMCVPTSDYNNLNAVYEVAFSYALWSYQTIQVVSRSLSLCLCLTSSLDPPTYTRKCSHLRNLIKK